MGVGVGGAIGKLFLQQEHIGALHGNHFPKGASRRTFVTLKPLSEHGTSHIACYHEG